MNAGIVGSSIPTVRPTEPMDGQLVFDPKVGKYQVYMGTTFKWVYFDESGSYDICVMCKKDLFDHADDHPFCKNNLVYLEWLDEQHNG